MNKYIKISYMVIATQWFKMGDHEKVVSWYSDSSDLNKEICESCHNMFNIHAKIKVSITVFTVCPGDWIIEDRESKEVIRILSDHDFKLKYKKYEEPTND